MIHLFNYVTGSFSYSVPIDLVFTYLLLLLRFLVFGFLITVYFSVTYSIITMIVSVILADLRFYIDFHDYIDSIIDDEDGGLY
jgi:hypothetical protein